MNLTDAPSLPNWLPDAMRLYLDHTADGQSLRALARREGRHASTVLRQVRRYENRRDDPLMDQALSAYAHVMAKSHTSLSQKQESQPMTVPIRPNPMRQTLSAVSDDIVTAEARRVLRRLAEPSALLAIAPDMEKAVVMREFPDGRSARTAVVDRSIAQVFVVKDWIACRKTGRVATYEMTSAGRAALKRMIDNEDIDRAGLAEATTPFADQHRTWESREVREDTGNRRIRYNLAESPVAVLGRRRDKDGHAFLEPELIEAAERLREDFEIAQMGPRVAQNWDKFLTGSDRGAFRPDNGQAEGPRHARDRVAAALRDLGPGLGDVVLRCCCFLEGLEVAERRLGWAARSGKIVLRIALQRLRRHYDETYGRSGPLIG